jgi:hypothetical protein
MRGLIGFASLMLVAASGFSSATPAVARGGAPNLMNSPGYQRALEESRKRYRDSASEPYVKRPAVYPRKKWKSRGRHH